MTTTFTRRNPRPLLRTALIVAAYLCAFIILDLISHQFEELRGIVAWYPPAGLTYALLLVFGERFTPAVTITLLISSVFIYHMPQPFYLLLLWALITSSIYGVAAAFLRHRIRFDWQLQKSRDVTWLVVTAVVVSALLAVLSVSSSALSSDMLRNEVLRAIFIWWIGETVGVLTITPFLLIHVMPRLKQFAEGQPVGSPARRSFPRPTLSVIGQAFSIAFMFYWVFGARGPAEFRPMYLLTLPLIWIALDQGFKGVTTGILVLNFGMMLAMWFFRFDLARLSEIQLLMIVNCIVGLLVGAVVTERKRVEEETVALQAQLHQSQKMDAIGQLAGGVAHDFNNLLTGILGNVAIIRSDLPSSDPLVANLLAVETAARQAADLAKGLLTFSRKAAVSAVSLDMTAAIDTTLAILKQSLPATMEIVRDDEQTAWNVLLDQSQLTQILLNLAVNARDAMNGKGTLTIRARNEVVQEEYVWTHPFARTGEFVHLSVTDTGPGIPPEILEHLFEPFHTTKPAGSGTGLGLSIVYGAVKQAGGWVTADSPGDGGTIFDVFLPRCLQKSSAPGVPIHLPIQVCSGTVLIVEDEPVVCAVAQALLTRSGYTVLTAVDGTSALSVLRDHPAGIGLILLDMTMPGMTNSEVVRAIRALDPMVPILLTSGYTSNGAVKQMLEEDSAQGFLPKPYELTELLGTINRLMKRD
jgi:signal transduction histidine kinase/CheY-like chemotaxis protein